MTTSTTINNVIKLAIEMGTARDEIAIDLYSNHNLSLGQANAAIAKYMKDNGLVVKKVSFDDVHNDWLLEADSAKPRTVKESQKFVKANGSDNVVKHMRHFDRQCELIAKAFAKGVASTK